jgi:hypothetical protein
MDRGGGVQCAPRPEVARHFMQMHVQQFGCVRHAATPPVETECASPEGEDLQQTAGHGDILQEMDQDGSATGFEGG